MNKKGRDREEHYGDARRRAEQHQTGFAPTAFKLPDGASLFSFKKAGVYRLDVLPYYVGKGNKWSDEGSIWYERSYFAHRGIGPESSMVCCLKSFNKRCPICEHQSKMARDPDSDPELVKSLRSQERQLWNVVDLADPNKGIQIMDQSNFLFGKLVDTMIKDADEDDHYEKFFWKKNGRTLKISVTEESFGGRTYFKPASIEFKARGDLPADILDKTHCLDELLIEKSYDDLSRLFHQTPEPEAVVEKEEEDDEDDAPRSRSNGSSSKSMTAPVDGDDDDDDDEDGVPHLPVKSSAKVVDDDDDDDDEPDDDSEALRRRKGK